MKRIMILLVLAVVAIATNAQVNWKEKGYMLYTGQAGDTAISGSAASVIFATGNTQMKLYQIEADIDETSGSANAIVKLYGSNDRSHYYLIDTLTTNNTGTGTEILTDDGTIGLFDLSTGFAWRFLKLELSLSTTGKWHFDSIRFRAVGKND